MTKTIIMDLDGTLTIEGSADNYRDMLPDLRVVDRVRRYAADGYRIAILTSRNMRTLNNSIGMINARTLPVVIDWLRQHEVPFDEVHVGKPWCGVGGFYVDDKAIRPSEFVELDTSGIAALLERGRGR